MGLSNRDKVIIKVFERSYRKNAKEVPFTLEDIRDAIGDVGYDEKNIPDLRYQYTSGRASFPTRINKLGPWTIQGRGKGRYVFVKLKRSPSRMI